jgi:hypothetical protein
MLISYMTKMMVMFSAIIVVGLFLTWINDGLERLVKQRRPARHTSASRVTTSLQSRALTPSASNQLTVKVISIPKSVAVLPDAIKHDYASKIVKIDLAPRSRASQNETGVKLGEHVTVHLPKAA